jgi:transposase
MDASMSIVYERCCGIDVHKDEITCYLITGQKRCISRTYGTLTKDLKEMSKWLESENCEMVAMESTGSYWKPLYNIFEMEGIKAMVVNAQHMRAIPGRKTDKNDARWIAKLLRHGLLKASFIPDREQREYRELTRYRNSRIEERAREKNRLQKMLEGANIKLSSHVSMIAGISSLRLLELAMGEDELTVEKITQVRDTRCKSSAEEFLDALTGVITPLQRELFAQVLKTINEQTVQIERIEALIKKHTTVAYDEAARAIEAIPGIGRISAEQIIAEIGTDMSRFPTAGHLCAWAGVAPGNNESAGKRKKGKSLKGNKTLKKTLTQSAGNAKNNKNTFFHAQFQRLVVRLGKNKSKGAVAHSMMIAIYHVLSGKQFVDLGADYYTQFNREKKIKSHLKQLQKLGWIPESPEKDSQAA